ncbi:MAG: DUF1273 family protein [Oscillospiraceae bacterium]|nr:DUF1273 family protein [Candidatus Equicaccousia limihippi]
MEKSVCFSGYRPEKFKFKLSSPQGEELIKDIENRIADLINKGYENFIVGGAMGFDTICGEILIKQKEEHPQINIYSYVPFKDMHLSFGVLWRQRAARVLENSTVTVLYDRFCRGCYFARNRKMVDDSQVLVCYFDGESGGTAYTASYAKKKGLEIINLAKNREL